MMLLDKLPVDVTVQPPAVKRLAAVSASPVLLVLLRTTSRTALSGSTATVGGADDELEAGALEAADDGALEVILGETDPVGVDDEWSATGEVRIEA